MDAAIQRYIEDHLPEYLDDLKRLCRQPSVAAQNYGVQECAQLTKQMLEDSGFSTQLLSTKDPRNLVVYAERAGLSTKRLLFYNHYDVQPAEPIGCGTLHHLNQRNGKDVFSLVALATTKAPWWRAWQL